MELKYDQNGLIPVITVNDQTGSVLMLAYMNAQSLSLTLKTGRAWYYSRSRKALWEKGATSGNVQEVVSLTADCDRDALLMRVRQTGNACHTGNYSCFFNRMHGEEKAGAEVLMREQAAIEDRKTHPKDGSYTNYLFDEGEDKICKKVAEEAGEVIIAAKNQDGAQLVSETADLLFHVQTLLAHKGIDVRDVFEEMRKRREKEGNLKKKNIKGEL